MQNKIDSLIKKLKIEQNEADKRAIAAQSSISTIDILSTKRLSCHAETTARNLFLITADLEFPLSLIHI